MIEKRRPPKRPQLLIVNSEGNLSRRTTTSTIDKNWDASNKDDKGPSHFATVVFTQEDIENQKEDDGSSRMLDFCNIQEENNNPEDVLPIESSMPILTNEKMINNFFNGGVQLSRNASMKVQSEPENTSKDLLDVSELKDLGKGRTVFEDEDKDLNGQLKYVSLNSLILLQFTLTFFIFN